MIGSPPSPRRCMVCALTVTALMLGPITTHADEARPPGEDQPPAVVSAPEAAPHGPAPAPVSYVRLNVRALDDDHKRARVFLRANDSSALLCAELPCTVDVPAGSELRATWAGDVMRNPQVFIVPSEPGSEVDIELSEASAVPLVTAVVLVVLGGAGIAAGVACAVSIGLSSWGGSSQNAGGGGGTGCTVGIGLGAVVLLSGIVLNAARSREPRVVVGPPRLAQETYGRRETALDDLASARPRDAASTGPALFPPPTYSFTF